jgi:hypothetical protein
MVKTAATETQAIQRRKLLNDGKTPDSGIPQLIENFAKIVLAYHPISV